MQKSALIGTHNSATGEPSKGLLSLLVAPFAKCQSKTIRQQYTAGCRLFDFRIKYNSKNELVFAHGLWTAKTKVKEVLKTLNTWSTLDDPIYCTIMYEGKLSEDKDDWWLSICEEIREKYPNLHILNVQVKYPWRNLKDYEGLKSTQAFKVLDGRSWHTYIPIPWLWDKLLSRPHVFNNEEYRFVDFL